MPWKKSPNVAMYAGADWSSLVLQVSNCTPAQAQRLALRNPDISFFFICNAPMYLDPVNGNPGRQFMPGDAVFFSGNPWFGSAPQCDSYQKEGMAVAYINPANSAQFQQIGCYLTADGLPSVDVVCIFAGNYASDELPYLRANNNNPPTTNPFNPNIQTVLSDGSVQVLQNLGITVLLTIMNGHSSVGWSEFTNETDAQNFANYLQTDIINMYGLDGIDIDDEYSAGQPQNNSLAMVTTLMRQLMPDSIISKALFADMTYFQSNWNGNTLAQNLNYGWEMSYYSGGPESRLAPYLKVGMSQHQLVLGFSAENSFQPLWPTVAKATATTMADGYEGGMLFDFENQPASLGIMEEIVNTICGDGNWNLNPACGS